MMDKQEPMLILTGNQGKVAEFERLLGMNLENVKLDLTEIQSTDVREVARYKAEEGYKRLNRPCLVDDTGLTVHEWGELPGALIKWFLKNIGNEGLIKMMASTKLRSATVTTAIGYCDAHGSQVFVGELYGRIADQPRGRNGFGYDPIFIPEGFEKTFAEMSEEEKNAISMRAKAAEALKRSLRI